MNQYLKNLKIADQKHETISLHESEDVTSLLSHYLAPEFKKSLTILE